MDLDFVETFYRAATLKSVSQAARDLHISLATALYRISKLETEIDAKLVDRKGREKQFRLTPKGESFLPQARRLLDLRREIEVELGTAQAEPSRLRIGAIESVLHSWLIPLIEKLTELRPSLKFDLTVETVGTVRRPSRRFDAADARPSRHRCRPSDRALSEGARRTGARR